MQVFDEWQARDWLIDYSGGIVRRGLSGEIIFALTPSDIDPVVSVALIQTFLAATIYILIGLLCWRSTRGPARIMLVLSPACLLFPALDASATQGRSY